MKKIFFIFLILFAGLMYLTGCNEDEEVKHEHVHEWINAKEIYQATCTEDGLELLVCKLCEETKTVLLKAIGHNEVIDSSIPATCIGSGLTQGSHCSVCNTILVQQEPVYKSIDCVFKDGLCVTCGKSTTGNILKYEKLENGTYKVSGVVEMKDNNVKISSSYNGCLVTEIGYQAFSSEKIESITIPSTIITIGNSAFKGCSKLKTVTFEDGSQLKTIGSSSFEWCDQLPYIILPKSVNSIGSRAFASCRVLESLTIPEGVTCIKTETFRGCDNFKIVVIPTSVTSIEEYAFYQCNKLNIVSYSGGYSNWQKISIAAGNWLLEDVYESKFNK